MNEFEFVFGFVTIISSLALTHLAASFVGLIRNFRQLRFSLLHAAFMWVAFATTVGNWGAFWGLQGIPAWPAWLVLLTIAAALSQYVFCALVSPPVGEGKFDLVAWDERSRTLYIAPLLVLITLSIFQNVGFRQYYADWLRDLVLSLIFGGFALLALNSNRFMRTLAATAMVFLTTYFMIASCGIGPLVRG